MPHQMKTDVQMTHERIRVLAEYPAGLHIAQPGVMTIPPDQMRINMPVEELVPDGKNVFTDGVAAGLAPLPTHPE